jgi:hypothetical protein
MFQYFKDLVFRFKKLAIGTWSHPSNWNSITDLIEASHKLELFYYLLDTLPIKEIKQAEMVAMTTSNNFIDLILAKDPRLTIKDSDLKDFIDSVPTMEEASNNLTKNFTSN